MKASPGTPVLSPRGGEPPPGVARGTFPRSPSINSLSPSASGSTSAFGTSQHAGGGGGVAAGQQAAWSYWALASGVVQQVVATERTAIKQAFYNTVANLFLILTLWAFFLLYFVFEQFVRPLLWAVTVGVCLHPLKQGAIIRTRAWLNDLKETDTPLLLGLLTLPFKLFNITEELVKQRWGRFFLFAAVLFCLFALDTVQQVVISTFLFLRNGLYLFVWIVEITVNSFFRHYAIIKSCFGPLVVSYLVILVICWRYHFQKTLRAVNIVAWCLGIITILPFLIEYLGMWAFLTITAGMMVVTVMGLIDRTSPEIQQQPEQADQPRSGTASAEPGAEGEDLVNSTEICMLLFMSCLAVTFWEWVPWLLFWGWVFSVLKWIARTYIDLAYLRQVVLLFLVYQFLRRGHGRERDTVHQAGDFQANQTHEASLEADFILRKFSCDKEADRAMARSHTFRQKEEPSVDEEGQEELMPQLVSAAIEIHDLPEDQNEQQQDDYTTASTVLTHDSKTENTEMETWADQSCTTQATDGFTVGDHDTDEEAEDLPEDDHGDVTVLHEASVVRLKRSHSAPLKKVVHFLLPRSIERSSSPAPVIDSTRSDTRPVVENTVARTSQTRPYPRALDITRRFPTRRGEIPTKPCDSKEEKEAVEEEKQKKDLEGEQSEPKEAAKTSPRQDRNEIDWRTTSSNEHINLASEVTDKEAAELLSMFVPYPFQLAFRWFMQGDKRVITWLHGQMNGIMTIVILLLLVSLVISLPIFFGVQFSSETSYFVQYSSDLWHTQGKHKVTQQLKELQSQDVAEAFLQFIQRVPEEARKWAEQKLKDTTGYDIPLSVWEDTLYQIWSNSPFGTAPNRPTYPSDSPVEESCSADQEAEQVSKAEQPMNGLHRHPEEDMNSNASIIADMASPIQPTLNATEQDSNLLATLRKVFWPVERQHQPEQPVCGKDEELLDKTNSSALSGPVRRLDLQSLFSHEGFINFFKANASILIGLWNQLKFSFTFIIGSLLNTLWSTSQRVYNFLFSVILFFTTLFYLLVASDDRGSYIPFKWFLFIFPKDGGTRMIVQEAITQAINEVFLSLLKISIFHALWTWLTLTLLGVRIVYISTFLTLLFVIFPVIGPYWVCIPACLELWFVVGKPVHAVVLFCLHLGASWYIDPKIYSEIKMGHYYVTGLAVVGGLYFLGLEGVIIGPTVLCVLLFLYKILYKIINP